MSIRAWADPSLPSNRGADVKSARPRSRACWRLNRWWLRGFGEYDFGAVGATAGGVAMLDCSAA